MKDLPLAVQWPGFAPFWAKADLIPDAVEEATQAMSALPQRSFPKPRTPWKKPWRRSWKRLNRLWKRWAEAAPEPVARNRSPR
ncbi:MAG: hypothetical protein WDN06_00900 [Asticcacaulis sp.]